MKGRTVSIFHWHLSVSCTYAPIQITVSRKTSDGNELFRRYDNPTASSVTRLMRVIFGMSHLSFMHVMEVLSLPRFRVVALRSISQGRTIRFLALDKRCIMC
jgi:hypothetical protein